MKIVVMNELVEKGGTEIQTQRERDLLRLQGHKVMYVTFDSNFSEGKIDDDENHFNFPFEVNTNIHKLCYRWAVNKKLKGKIIKILQHFEPDCIHINNITDVRAVTVYRAIKKYFSVQTIRDYSAICPTSLCIYDSGEVCEGFHSVRECQEKCKEKNSSSLKGLLGKITYMNHKLARISAINIFIAPSKCLTEYCNQHGMTTVCIPDPIDFSLLQSDKVDINYKYKSKKYLFYGLVAEHKGIFELISAFKRFSKETKAKLYIVGDIEQNIKERFDNTIKECDKIEYLGKYSYVEVMSLLTEIYTVIVPSRLMENYPNTALEGIANKCIVIGSNRGGIPELIDDEKFIFDITNVKDLYNKLQMTYFLDFTKYQQLVEKNYQRINQNNSLESYYFRLMKTFENS